jgi:hypothetical protein
MFLLNMPKSFKLGDSVDCRINGEPARVTWRDADHLVIEPSDVRLILAIGREGELNTFMCGDPGAGRSDYDAEMGPGGMTLSGKW